MPVYQKLNVRGPFPAVGNDNVPGLVHPLSWQEVEAIINEHGIAIGSTIDQTLHEGGLGGRVDVVVKAVLARMPELQRWIVGFGSDLEWSDIEKLQEGAFLFNACVEVINTTWAEYDGSLAKVIVKSLRGHSEYLSGNDVI